MSKPRKKNLFSALGRLLVAVGEQEGFRLIFAGPMRSSSFAGRPEQLANTGRSSCSPAPTRRRADPLSANGETKFAVGRRAARLAARPRLTPRRCHARLDGIHADGPR